MHELPFEIPQSLNTYLNRFQSDPDKGIADLEAFLKKRGMDAVGYFLLSWLCLNSGRKEEALRHALKAKSFAPGSPFFQHLHYFLVHPDHFDAWKPFAPEEDVLPEEEQGSEQEPEPEPDPSLNLDTLIEKLSDAEKNRITISPGHDDDRNLDESSKKVGDIASETLAMIYEKQKKYSDALRTLNKLSKTRPDKADHYRQEIERIRALMNREELED